MAESLHPTNHPKKNIFFKLFFRVVLVALSICLLSIALLPSLISSSWGKEQLTSLINHSIPGEVKIENLSLSWFGPQKIYNGSLADPENNPVLSFESVNAEASLFSLIFHPVVKGAIKVSALNATIVADADGNTNLMRSLDSKCCVLEIKNIPPPLAVNLENTEAFLNLSPDNKQFSLHLSGETQQNAIKGTFTVNAEIEGINLQDALKNNKSVADLLNKSNGKSLQINADISNFPVELLDTFISLRSKKAGGFLSEILGEGLNFKIDQTTETEGMLFDVNANSSTFNAQAKISLDRVITLINPANISLVISPHLVEKGLEFINLPSKWKLAAPARTTVNIETLTLPLDFLNFPRFDLDKVGLLAALELTEANFVDQLNHENLNIQSLQATINTQVNAADARIKVLSTAMQHNKPIKIDLDFTLPKKGIFQDSSLFLHDGTSSKGVISGAPLIIVDQLTGFPFSTLVGSTADLNFSLQMQNSKAQASLELKTEHLETAKLNFSIDKYFVLQNPAVVVLTFNQNILDHLALNSFQMQGPATAQLTFNSFSIPLSKMRDLLSIMFKASFDTQLKVTPIRLANISKLGSISLNDISLRLSSNGKMHPEIAASFNLQPDGQSSLAGIIGKKTNFKTAAKLGMGPTGKLSARIFNLQILSELARIELSGEMHDEQRLVLNAPSMFSYTFTPEGLQSMGISADSYSFKHGSLLEMTLDSSYIPASFDDLSLLKLNGKLKVNDFQLMKITDADQSLAVIDTLAADWSVDGAAEKILLDFSGVTRLGGNQATGKLEGVLSFDRWLKNGLFDAADATIQLSANASKLPTEFLSVLSGQKNLVPILGNALDIAFEVNTALAQDKEGILSIDINSENLSGGLALSLGDIVQLSRNRPADFSLKLTPQGYAALRRNMNENPGDFTLQESTIAKFHLHSLRILQKQLMQSSFEGDFALGKVVGVDPKTNSKIVFNQIQGNVSSHNLTESINFKVNAEGQNQQNNPASWDMTGSLTDGFLTNGSLNRESLSMSLDATVESLPIPLLCQFACLDPKLQQKIEIVFGPLINAKIQAKLNRMNGLVYMDINGINGKIVMDAAVNEGVLTLNQNLIAQLTVSPQLGEYVLKDLIPILSGMLGADHPVNLTINREGFSLPLRNPSVRNITIDSGVLDMGKVHFSGESQIAKVLDLLTPAASTQLVWLTPAYFSLNQGFLKLARVDMLISDRYPIAAWGDADVGKDRVNMVVALSGSAISKAFNVPTISNAFFLQLPLRGKLSNPSIDKTKALARISALVAQSQGGPQGLVLGTVLNIASGGLAENAIPAPTTNPLPWSELLNESPSSEQVNQINPDQENKINPIKEIQKGASSIFKKIFR